MANLQRSVLATLIATTVATGLGGCEDPATATGLHPEGPPKLQQVVMKELYTDASNVLRVRTILAFGTHPDVEATRTKSTETAAANDQRIRVVVDELLRGNHLEEIACRSRMVSETQSCVIPSGFSRVPDGATPDDIADCAAANDLLDDNCGGPLAVCLDGAGVPCGVFDEDENGSADNTRMIEGQVRIVCDGADVPLDLEQSYWQPAGNQLVPAGLTPEGSLGPAVILAPRDGRLPTNSSCQLAFAGDVTDKDGNAICAPAGGDITVDCTPGDISAFSFKTEAMRMTSSSPEDNFTGIPRSPVMISTFWNAPIDPASITNAVTITPPLVNPQVALNTAGTSLTITSTTDYAAATLYTVTISGITDTFGKALPTPVTFDFTTAN